MIDSFELMRLRGAGEARLCAVSLGRDDMKLALTKFGLKAEPDSLVQHDRAAAIDVLKAVLWKDMAYEHVLMSPQKAAELAFQIVDESATPESKFFSNGNWGTENSWNPMTEATFDTGLIVTRPKGQYFCIWFEDED